MLERVPRPMRQKVSHLVYEFGMHNKARLSDKFSAVLQICCEARRYTDWRFD
jgi:hypothetical protein